MKNNIVLTFSKLSAAVIIILAFVMDLLNDRGGTVFMYSLPFAVALITGKQVVDWKKNEKNKQDNPAL